MDPVWPVCSCLSIICLVSITIIVWKHHQENFGFVKSGRLIILSFSFFSSLDLFFRKCRSITIQGWILGARLVINCEENDSKVEWARVIGAVKHCDGSRTLDGRLEHWMAHLLPYTRLALARHWIVNTTQLVGMLLPSDSALRLSAPCSTLQIQSLYWRAHQQFT